MARLQVCCFCSDFTPGKKGVEVLARIQGDNLLLNNIASAVGQCKYGNTPWNDAKVSVTLRISVSSHVVVLSGVLHVVEAFLGQVLVLLDRLIRAAGPLIAPSAI